MIKYQSNLALTGIELGRGIKIRKKLAELQRQQWLTYQELIELQTSKVKRLVQFAGEQIPFYIHLFAEKNWTCNDFQTLTDLQKLPVITKSMVRHNPKEFMPEQADLARYKSRHTGGSTGEPFSYRVSNSAFGWFWAAIFCAWMGTGYKVGDQMLTLGGASLRNDKKNLIGQRIYDFLRNNLSVDVGQLAQADLDRIVTILQTKKNSLIYGYPSIIYLVAQHVINHNIQLSGVARIITTSEMLFAGQRKVIEQAFNAPVYDHYGCPEGGLVSNECEFHQGFHYAMELSYVEILDENYINLPIGQTGHIVTTNLLNQSMCMLRYDTGDIGQLSDTSCRCGRGLQIIESLQGRSRDLIHTPSGKVIHGVSMNTVMYHFPWIDRYQISQNTLDEIKLNISVSRDITPSDMALLKDQLAVYTGISVKIAINEPFILTPGKKSRVIISTVWDK
jgi:phenylacetate-CoA ligase